MFRRLVIFVVLIFISGCATVQERVEVPVSLPHVPEAKENGVYHKVRKGETIWRIARAYGVDVEDIIRINNIPDVAQVEENQLVFIPGALSVKEISIEKEGIGNDFIWPIQGKVMSYFHQRRNGSSVNEGIDIKGVNGQSVKAARSGKIVLADYLTGFGFTVIIDHSDNYYTVYGRNAQLSVALDDYVRQGDEIAKLGRMNADNYLHFEIRKSSVERNPLHYLP